jgi:hypothetical protein
MLSLVEAFLGFFSRISYELFVKHLSNFLFCRDIFDLPPSWLPTYHTGITVEADERSQLSHAAVHASRAAGFAYERCTD